MSALPTQHSLAVCIQHPENDLVAAECANLTGAIPDKHGIAGCDSLTFAARSACVRTGANVIARGVLSNIRPGAGV
jgi:hypothetical protein